MKKALYAGIIPAITLPAHTLPQFVARNNVRVAGWTCSAETAANGIPFECDPECEECDGTSCQKISGKAKATQKKGDCATELCDGSQSPNLGDAPKDQPNNCATLRCRLSGGTELVLDSGDIRLDANQCEECSPTKIGSLQNKEDGISCGDGTPEQSCWECQSGNCGAPSCTADSTKQDIVPGGYLGKAGALLENAVSDLEDPINAGFKKVPKFISPEIEIDTDFSAQQWSACCPSCLGFEEEGEQVYGVSARASATATVLLGLSDDDRSKLNGHYYVGFVKDRIQWNVATPNIELSLNVGARGEYEAFENSDCRDGNCGSVSGTVGIGGDVYAGAKGSFSVSSYVVSLENDCMVGDESQQVENDLCWTDNYVGRNFPAQPVLRALLYR